MRDIRKLRKDEAELGEEAEHLAGDALDVVLAADMTKPATLLRISTWLRTVMAFCTQFNRSAILK
jgi:hypothetical protein